MLWRFIRHFFCRHEYRFLRNIHGDECFVYAPDRSIWECTKCTWWEFRKELNEEGPICIGGFRCLGGAYCTSDHK